MIQETYGVVKWLTKKRLTTDQINETIETYGKHNHIEVADSTSPRDAICMYIQQTGFDLFTAWFEEHQ